MYVYIVRHCQANDPKFDPEKHLSEIGREEAEALTEFLKPLNIHVGYIFHSGKMRAKETAEILSSAIESSGGVSRHSGLNPEDYAAKTAKELLALNEDLMVVSHLPFVEELAAYILKGDSTKCGFDFNTGTMMCLKKSGNSRWKLEWTISPALLSKK